MNKKQNKCYKFQNKIGNVDNDKCFGGNVGIFKTFMSGSKLNYLKSVYYCKTMDCNKCEKLLSENRSDQQVLHIKKN